MGTINFFISINPFTSTFFVPLVNSKIRLVVY